MWLCFLLICFLVFIHAASNDASGFSAFNKPLTSPAGEFSAFNKPSSSPAPKSVNTEKKSATPETKTTSSSKKQEKKSKPTTPSSSMFKTFPRFSLADLQMESNAEYAEGLLPFVITDVVTRWGAIEKWNNVQYFERLVPEEIVDWYPNNLMKSDDHPILTGLHNAVNTMKRSLSTPAYIQMRFTTQGRKMLFGDIDMETFPALLQSEWWSNKQGCLTSEEARDNWIRTTQWNMLLIGNKGAGMFMHPDGLNTGTWQAQVAGDKMWFLCSPDQAPYLYGPGVVDAFKANLTRFPLFAHARCIHDVVKAGEILYYPSNWWHQTLNLHFPTVGLAGRAVTKYNFRGVREHLLNKCKSKDPDLSLTYPGASPNPSPEVCKSIQKCYQLWRARFGKP